MSWDILDAVIANTVNGSSVVSRNDDVGSINWVRGMSDPGEMIACGAYQQLRRANGESDRDYQERIETLLRDIPAEHAAKIRAAGVKAAQERAQLDATGGMVRAIFAGKPAWHELGVTMSDVFTSKQALDLAGLDIEILKVPMSYDYQGRSIVSKETFALVRADTGAFLASVGKRYQTLQTRDAFDFVDGVFAEHGARYESAGMLYGGQQVFLSAHFPRYDFAIGKASDTQAAFATLVNKHGDGACRFFPSEYRAECANTTAALLRDNRGKGLSIRHTGDIKAKIRQGQEALGIAIQGFSDYKDGAEAMYRTECKPMEYFDGVLDMVLDITKAEMTGDPLALFDAAVAMTEAQKEAAAAKVERDREKRAAILADIYARHESERCANGRGTLWSAFNAVTESADHGALAGRQIGENKADRRFESIMYGRAAEIKETAYTSALALTAR